MDGAMAIRMKEYTQPFCSSRIGTIIVCLIFLLSYGRICQGIDDELSNQLAAIRSRSFEKGSDYTLAETDALHLLDVFPASFGTGRVYLAIEKVYAKSIDAHPQKVAEYCEKSLQTAPDAAECCSLYADWGSALERQRQNARETVDSAKGRRETVKPFLRAWNIIFTNDLPDTLEDLPGVGKFDYTGSKTDQMYLATTNRHDAEWAAREKVRIKNDLVLCRARIVSDNIALLYQGQNAISDLRADAMAELHNPAAVEDLVERVQKFKQGVEPAR
jgi:hypothetical protein